ncbi:cullin-associated NEDD8-dissociated protein 1 [Tanacetum coccineum]
MCYFCMGLVVSTFGDHLTENLPAFLPIIVDRMGNEVTRLTAVKAFVVIAASPLHLELSCVLEHVIVELTAFLRRRSGPTVGLTVRNKVLPQALALVKSSLLQGQALLLLHYVYVLNQPNAKRHRSLFMYLNDTRKILALSHGLVLRGNHSMLLIFVAVGACFDSS